MEPWSNIVLKPDDPEIKELDKLEAGLGEIPVNVRQIRELITGFEVCHFKYRQHIRYIIDSINDLKPNIKLQEIGANHIRHGQDAWKKDKTGRSLTGLQYVRALKDWLGESAGENDDIIYEPELYRRLSEWLGHKDPEKERLVRLLIARLIWDWKSYEELRTGKEEDELEFQVCRMDICHYIFPGNMDLMIQGIGQLKPVKGFEGCGTFNRDIKKSIESEISALNVTLDSFNRKTRSDNNKLIKLWLFACFAKTLKEQTDSKIPIHGIWL